MELYCKTTDDGWRLFYTDKAAMDADVENEEFVAQAKDGQVMNFWGTITVQIGTGANVELVVRRLLDMQVEIGGELA